MIRFLRRKQKTICVLLCFVMAQSAFPVTSLFALSTGPEQVEFSSYEGSEAPDLVNLLTGDFNYSLPVVQIPGPEGSFTVPLFYHAGITPEQDASWTGLGWNVNPGSITRQVVGYADDAYDNPVNVNVKDPGGSGWIKNYMFYRRMWDSQKGYGGAISLMNFVGVEWNNSSGLQSGTAIGMNFNKSGIKGYWAENVMNVAQVAGSLASMGASGGEVAAAGGATAKNAALDVAMGAVSSAAGVIQGYLSSGKSSSRYFNWNREVDAGMFKTRYKYWLDDTRTERAFGSLYLGSTENSSLNPTLNPPDYNDAVGYPAGTDYPKVFKVPYALRTTKGFKRNVDEIVTSDMHVSVLPGENYSAVTRSNHISFDQFNVMTEGIDGTISPYRLEMGSLAQPKRYNFMNTAHNVIPFLTEDNGQNKVQFKYNGQFSNTYQYHKNSDYSFGIIHNTSEINGKRYMVYEVPDDKLIGGDRTEVDATRINGKKIISGKNIEWYSNEDILSGVAKAKGFIDAPNSRPSYATKKGIGGFSITKEDGVTYHYALPVYQFLEMNLVGTKGDEKNKYSRSLNQSPVAITWLLTAITGPDFVDRGQSGLVDDEDWGYWIKFAYGRTSNYYEFRAPYMGYFDDGTSLSFSQGIRDQYYLNSIETRSHTALFIKGVRTDGLGSYFKANDPNYGHPMDQGLPTPTPPLCLDEVVLLTKSDLAQLRNQGFNERVNGELGFDNMLGNNGSLSDVFDIADVSVSNRTFINAKALRRVKFVYETDNSKRLCNHSLNSFADPGNPPALDVADIYSGKEGKLTLKRLQFYGRNSVKVFPDYKFEYGFNPDYNKDNWDGWGYYTSAGATSHMASQNDQDGAAWSLSKLVLPSGGEIIVSYERDTYSSISGEKIIATRYGAGGANDFVYNGPVTLPSIAAMDAGDRSKFTAGELVKIEGSISYSYNNKEYSNTYSKVLPIVAITSDGLDLGPNYVAMEYYNILMGTSISVRSNNASVYKLHTNKKGGDIRVSELSFINEFGEYSKNKYSYTQFDGFSSGVVAKEPEFIKDQYNPDNYGLDVLYDCPNTSVMYSRVVMSSGYNRLSNTYTTRQVYEFETPSTSFVKDSGSELNDYVVPGYHYITGNGGYSETVYFKQYFNKIEVRNSRIGKLKSLQTLDASEAVIERTDFTYTENTPLEQGKYTSGSILSEMSSGGDVFKDYHVLKLIRSEKIFYPYVLSQMSRTKDGFTETKSYKAWDFFTGEPTLVETKSKGGIVTQQEVVPAYRAQYTLGSNVVNRYATMGLKASDPRNSNMITQAAATYTFLMDGAGNRAGLLAAGVTTWKNDWDNYRVYSSSSGLYSDGGDGPTVWRKSSAYIWLGDYSRYRPDGSQTFSETDRYSFDPSSSVSNRWKITQSVNRYDHYSNPLTTSAVLGLESAPRYSSVRIGYGDKFKIAEAADARLEEMAFSGAEDLQSNDYFGGEVKRGNGAVITSSFHTGKRSLLLTSGTGFVYKASVLTANRAYKASVWTSTTDGRIYYKINGGPEVLSDSPVLQRKVGNWYLLDFIIPAQSASFSVEVGVRNVGNSSVFDDFRFRPADADLISYVYNPDTYTLDYVIDSHGLYMRYEYDDRGFVKRIYRESFKYGERLDSEVNDNYRRFNVD